jgi:hypothetical protein
MYSETAAQSAQRILAFTYHPPGGNQGERYTRLRALANQLAQELNVLCPPSRELSLAQTKLEEAVMWANAAIARNETQTKPKS